MRFLSLVAIVLVFGGVATAGDCLRVAPAPIIQTGYSQGFTQAVTSGCGGYTDVPTQTLEIRRFSAPVYAPQAFAFRAQNFSTGYYVAPVQNFRAQNFHAQGFRAQQVQRVQRIEVNNGAGVGVIGVLNVLRNTLGAIIGR
jgi:hypothetical protein